MTSQYKKDLCEDLTASAQAQLDAAAIYEPNLTWRHLASRAQENVGEAMKWEDKRTTARSPQSQAAQRAMAHQELRFAAVQMIAAYLKAKEADQ